MKAKFDRKVVSNGILVMPFVEWQWGPLTLMNKQADDQRYYVYHRDAVQGKFVVVKLAGYVPICTCQTKGGAFTCCAELNTLAGRNEVEGDD